jgi:serine/threonine-protein kinase
MLKTWGPMDRVANLEADDRTISDAGSSPPETRRGTVLAGRYELSALMGRGGMGAVYRARDLELDEVVAVKMLNRGFDDSNASILRFRREVKLARRVTHRNVARTFDIGEHEGDRFLTMELVEGVPLSTCVSEHLLTIERVAEIAYELCAGLSAAHAAGVIHRDLKPENLLLAKDGRVVITDFGIACAAASDAEEPRGHIVGTPAYMAPEQVEALPDVDARADIYALGAILYELFTGERAWRGESVYIVAGAKLVSPPPDPRDRRVDLPDEVAELVLRCMARAREARFSDVDSVAEALRAAVSGVSMAALTRRNPAVAPASVSGAPQPNPPGRELRRKSVAVLPFRSDDPDDLHIAAGVTDDIIDVLSGSPALRVRARGGSPRGGAERDACAVGRALGVDVVVEGSVRRAADLVRVSVRLLSVADGFQLWARRYEVSLSRVFSVGDEAASAVCEAVTLEFHGAPRVHSADSAAIDLYMRARLAYHTISRDSLERAIALFHEALEHAPDDPRILAGLAMAMVRHLYYDESETAASTALATAKRALAVSPGHVDARVALATVLLGIGQPDAAAVEIDVALRAAPENPDALEIGGRLVSECGRLEEGIAMFDRAVEIDPARAGLRYEAARLRALLGAWEDAEVAFESPPDKAFENHYWAVRPRVILWKRDAEAATAALSIAEAGTFILRSLAVAILAIGAGRMEAGPIVAELAGQAGPQRARRRRVLYHQLMAEACGFAGDVPGLVLALEGGAHAGLFDVGWLDRCPLFDGHRQRPEFRAVRDRVAERAEAVSRAIAVVP